MASRRRRKSKFCNYLITTTQNDLSRGSIGYVGKLRANFLGTGFLLYSNGARPPSDHIIYNENNIRDLLCSIQYEQNVMGLKGPRKMTILLPALIEDTRVSFHGNFGDNYFPNQQSKDPKLVCSINHFF